MRVIATLDHPHILPLYDFGEEQINRTMLTYMVMPFRPEGSLTDWLQQRNALPPPSDIADMVAQAADALDHAHQRQIIHMDVKPSNFLIRGRQDPTARPQGFSKYPNYRESWPSNKWSAS
jgi:serine/threonine protein kinase